MTGEIHDVSDTSFWVAHYRAIEGDRPDALFRDPWAKRLAGDKGRDIAARAPGGKYTHWSVVIRTCVIDALVQQAVAGGADTVLCLGAGLDARPYRLALPRELTWVEVDYPHVIRFKEEKLAADRPTCQLRRVAMDLADRPARQALFAQIDRDAKQVLVLTEGVVPYLTPAQVGELADDLRHHRKFRGWVVEYLAPGVLTHIARKNRKTLRQAPFLFRPGDWFGFFDAHGWQLEIARYLPEAARELGRPMPVPWFVKWLQRLPGAERRHAEFMKMSAFVLLRPAAPTA